MRCVTPIMIGKVIFVHKKIFGNCRIPICYRHFNNSPIQRISTVKDIGLQF